MVVPTRWRPVKLQVRALNNKWTLQALNDREIYLTEDPIEAGFLLDKAIVGYRSDGVEEPPARRHPRALTHDAFNHHRVRAAGGGTHWASQRVVRYCCSSCRVRLLVRCPQLRPRRRQCVGYDHR
jgi:hypothetical protein